jgi:hypothetical protein
MTTAHWHNPKKSQANAPRHTRRYCTAHKRGRDFIICAIAKAQEMTATQTQNGPRWVCFAMTSNDWLQLKIDGIIFLSYILFQLKKAQGCARYA